MGTRVRLAGSWGHQGGLSPPFRQELPTGEASG